MIHGPDVSSYQTRIDWEQVATRASFAIVKVTQGNLDALQYGMENEYKFIHIGSI